MIRTLLFDCFGVMYVGVRSYVMSQCDESRRDQLDDLFNQADYGFVTSDEFTHHAAQLLDMDQVSFIAMTNRHYHRDERVVELIRRLKADYSIGLLTNANDSIIRQLFTPVELTELFDDVLVSSEVGMVKPQASFFELAATRLDCTPDECIMIDDIASNIQGAVATGMKGVVFTDASQCQRALKELGVYA